MKTTEVIALGLAITALHNTGAIGNVEAMLYAIAMDITHGGRKR